MALSFEEVARIVEDAGAPKSVVLMLDNIRRTGIIYLGMSPEDPDFEEKVFKLLNEPYIRIIENVYRCGVRCIIIPAMSHDNLRRYERYLKTYFRTALRWILRGEEWLSLYRRMGVKVKIYGDLEFFGKVAREVGCPEALDWCREVEEETRGNGDRLLLWGMACSASLEAERIVRLGIEFYNQHGRAPTREELIEIYYGERLGYPEIFIRPGEMRDSDCQPPLIGGRSEMYFPVVPLTHMPEGFFKEILYDYLFCRIKTFGKKKYRGAHMEYVDEVRKYYEESGGRIIGIGKRIGDVWVPLLGVRE